MDALVPEERGIRGEGPAVGVGGVALSRVPIPALCPQSSGMGCRPPTIHPNTLL